MAEQEDLVALLAEKKELFLACERATGEMSVCQVEELDVFSRRRQEAIDGAIALDVQIETLSAADEAIQAALHNSCDRRALTPRLGAIYDASLAVKAVANRILQNEDTVRGRIELEKERLLDKIQNINSSGSAVAVRYGKSVGLGVSRPVAMRQDKKA